jgi:hypothetical protein
MVAIVLLKAQPDRQVNVDSEEELRRAAVFAGIVCQETGDGV